MPMTYEERSMMLLGAAGCTSAETSQPGQNSRPAARGGRRGTALTRQSRREALIRTIEGQIVPRLLLARASVPPSEAPMALPLPGVVQNPQAVAELTRLLLEHTSEVASVYVQLIHADGASIESILLNVLAPAARRLGALWESDEVDFFAVSLGLARLQTIVRELSTATPQEDSPPGLAGTILLVPEMGEQHTFGLQLVAEFFRRSRWDVWLEQPATVDEYARLIAAEHFAVIGLGVGSDSKLEHLAGRIAATRRGSRNRNVCVMVGGPVLLSRPEIARQVGADATATDGPQAVQIAQTLVKSLAAAGVSTT
jgi:MerR family transcriptional regulator, light-induced transcriptional regulator